MENDKEIVISNTDLVRTDTVTSSSVSQPLVIAEEKIDVNFEKGLKLTEDEKKKLNESKKKETKSEVPKVTVVKDTNYNKQDFKLTEDEMTQCLALQKDLTEFLNDKIDMNPSTGIIETLPTGVDILDAILGGGFGVGTLTLIVGNPGTFKSALLGQVIGASQRKFRGKVISSYLDSEEAMTVERLMQLGVRLPPLKPYNDISVELVFKTIEGQCVFKELKKLNNIPSIVAWDSVANTITEKDRESDSQNSTIGLKARILSFALPKYISKMRKYNVALIAVNQLREKLEMNTMVHTQNDMRYLGQDKTMPGGQALKYNAFHCLHLKIKADLKFEQWGFNGVLLECKCVKNKLFTPNIPVEMVVDFNSGISNFWTNYKFLTEDRRMKTGAWNYLVAKPELKFRTKEAIDLYNKNENGFKDVFDSEVKSAIQTSLIDKYKNVFRPETDPEEEDKKSIEVKPDTTL